MAKINTKLRIAILGPGAIGGFLAALFWKDGHNVICVGNKDSVTKIQNHGIEFESQLYGNFIAKPNSVEVLNLSVDVLFISIKAPFMSDALKRINADFIKSGTVIPLLNGVGHGENIRDSLGPRVATGTIGSIEVVRNKNRDVCHLSSIKPHIEIASNDDISKNELKIISKAIESVGISIDVLESESEVIWNKLIRLNAIASLTTAYQTNIGKIRSNFKLNSLLNLIVKESALVAEYEGVSVDCDKVINQINRLSPLLETSMQRDVELGRKSELEYITGGVLRLAKSYKISVPTHEYIYRIIRERIISQTLKIS
jgi:2-dehydropantoate 2-reductase